MDSAKRPPAAISDIRTDAPVRRIVVFTSNQALFDTPLWSVLEAAPGVGEVLVCIQAPPRGASAALRRLRRNLKKHGALFIPYRLAATVLGTEKHIPGPNRFGKRALLVETVHAPSIHAPEILEAVRQWKPDLGISLGAPVLRPELFGIPPNGTVNIHCGEVPTFRGAPPAFWELVTGADRIGATLHRMDAGLDTGDILGRETALLYPEDTLATATSRAYELGETVLARVLPRILVSPGAQGASQEPGGTTYRQPLVAQRISLGWRLLRRVVRRAVAPRNVAKTAAAVVILSAVRPLRDFFRTLRGRQPVRIFTFHRVTTLCRDGMTVSPSVFQAQIKYLRRKHDIVSLEKALSVIASGERLRRPLAVIAFDDAYESVYTHAAPVLRAQGVVGTCFAATGLLGTSRTFDHDAECPVRDLSGVMTWEELSELHQQGWSTGSHTVNHARLSECDPDSLRAELTDSQLALKAALDLDAVAIAYPFGGRGDINDAARSMVREVGYAACLSDFGGENFPGDDLFELKRIDIGANHARLMWKLYANGYDLASIRGGRSRAAR